MKASNILLLTHGVAAAAGAAGAFIATNSGMSLAVTCVATLTVVVFVLIQAWMLATVLKRSLQATVNAVANADDHSTGQIKIKELETAANKLCEYAQRWSETASASRRHLHEIEEVSLLLDRRTSVREGQSSASGIGVRRMLGGIADAADSDLIQILSCIEEISHCMGDAARQAEDQVNALTKTATCVDQISASIDAVHNDTTETCKSIASVETHADEAATVVLDLMQGIDRACENVDISLHKLQGLSDHSREINAVIETISSVAARTDLLALNASIESVRAGEHGRGFAVVAEEVHRLAEQTSLATRDVAALIEAVQCEAREVSALAAQQRLDLEQDVDRADSARQLIERIKSTGNSSTHNVGELAQAMERQLTFMGQVVSAVERMADVAKSTRGRTEKGHWTTKTLSKLALEFESVLEPLRACSDAHNGRPRRSAPSGPMDSLPEIEKQFTNSASAESAVEDREVASIS